MPTSRANTRGEGGRTFSVTVTNPIPISTTHPHDHESARASVTSLYGNRWLKGYVRGKLRIDPMYGIVFEYIRETSLPILDLGCGIGILLYYLRHRGLQLRMTGVDWDTGRIAVAQHIAQSDDQNLSLILQDARIPIQFLPMWGGTPFNNYLFVFRRPNAQSSLFARDSQELREKRDGRDGLKAEAGKTEG